MGLFDDLPSAKRPTEEVKREPSSPASKRVKIEEPDEPEPSAAAAAPEPTPAPAAAGPSQALDKIAVHIANPKKFTKAASLALTLMRSGELSRAHGKSLFKVLSAAMEPTPRRANDAAVRFEYRELFDAAEECAEDGVLNAKHKARLAVWLLYARTINDVHTDDTFQFAKAAKAIRALIEGLGEYEERPEEEDGEEMAATVGGGAGDGSSNDGSGGGGGGGGQGGDDAERAFAARMRAAEFRAATEAWQLREDERTALLDAVDAAHSHYKFNWAQTTVDMLVDFAHEHRDKFSEEQRDHIVEVWEAVRDKKNARKGIGGGGGGGGGDQTSFERGAAVYKNAAISIRRAVGGEGCADGRGESSCLTFG